MSRIKYIVFFFLLMFSINMSAQPTEDNIEAIRNTILQHIEFAGNDAERGNYYIAESTLDEQLVKALNIKDHKLIGMIYTKLAKIKFALGESDKALTYLFKASDTQRVISDRVNLAETYNTFGLVYAKKKDYTSALENYDYAKKYAEKGGVPLFVPKILLNKSDVHIELGEFKQANELLERSIVLAKNKKLTEILSSALIKNSQTLLSLGRYDKALSQAEEGLKIAIEEDNSFDKSLGYKVLSKIYHKTNDPVKAYTFLEKHTTLSDSILDRKRELLEADDSAKLIPDDSDSGAFFTQQEVEEFEKQGEQLELSRLTTILSIALITILSLLTLSLYKNNNIRLKTNNMLHKKNDELIVAKEKAELASRTKANFLSTVTHELRTPLYAVTGLTNMLLDESPKKEQVQHLKSLKFSGDYLLTFINDILQINKIEAKLIKLK